MADIFYDDQADLAVIQRRHVARARLRQSGARARAVAARLRRGRQGRPAGGIRSREGRRQRGAAGHHAREACEEADLIMVLAPDHVQRAAVRQRDRAEPGAGDALFFAPRAQHPLRLITPPADVDVAWSPPRGPATWCAASSSRAGACPCWSRWNRTPRASAWALALSYAKGIGGTRAGALIKPRSARRPRPTCSASRRCSAAALSELIKAGFDTLVEAGYAARDGLLRVPARDEADRRPDL